jgi:hypothetical protein
MIDHMGKGDARSHAYVYVHEDPCMTGGSGIRRNSRAATLQSKRLLLARNGSLY